MIAPALAITVVLCGDPKEWNEYGKKPARAPVAKTVASNATPGSGVPAAAQERYQEAVDKLAAKQYGAANDVLNALAGDHPRVAEIFASRCSAQLGLQHWAAAEADCDYSLKLKQLPTAVYGLAVAEDGQGKYPQAIGHYRQYAGLADATAALKQQAVSRAELLVQMGHAPAASAARTEVADVAPAVSGGAKGQFQPGIPDPGEGLLYVYRNILMGIGTGATLLVDNVRVGELPNDHYYELKLRPGKHSVVIQATVNGPERRPPVDTMAVEVAEGTVGYLKLEYWPRAEEVGFKLVSVGKEGRKEIREDCALSGSKKF